MPKNSHANIDLELISSARAGMLRNGVAACSARMIAEAARTSPSAINYAFGGIKHLFGAVFGEAIDETRAFIATLERESDLWPTDPAFATHALEGVIERWVAAPRDLALLYQQAIAHRDYAAPEVDAWMRLWAEFFARFAARQAFGADRGALMNLLFQSEALFALSPWRPLLGRSALRDLVGHFGAIWLGAAPSRPTGALAMAEQAVRLPTDRLLEGPALTIMMAAVDVVAELGLAGLTHRAVASRCGVTAGAVAHYFRTASDLLAAAIRGQVVALQSQDGPASRLSELTSLQDLEQVLVFSSTSAQGVATVCARRSLFLASLADPNQAHAGAVVRFAAGATIRAAVRGVMPHDPNAELHASVLSRLLSAAVVAAPPAEQPFTEAQALAACALKGFADALR